MNNFEAVFVPIEIEKSDEKNALLKGVQVTAAGYFPEAFGHDYARDAVKYMVVIYCTAGKGYYQYKDKTWEVNAGEILYCWKGTAHHYWADKENPWTIFWLHVQGKEVELLLKESGLNANQPLLKVGHSSQLISLFREILDVLKGGFTYHRALYVSSLAKQIFSFQYFLMKENSTIINEDKQFKDILIFLQAHINETLDIATMAKQSHLSATYFIRKFKQKFGYSPVVYFNRLKIQSACHLLLMSNRSVKEIAFSLGFEDPLYFSRLFRKIMNVSPLEYRKSR
jgi:AraC-like DNA-binding protein